MKIKFFLLDADYFVEGGETKIRLWGKTEEGKNAVLFFKEDPYFFVLPKDFKKALSDIKKLLDKKKIKVKKIEKVKMKLNGKEKDFLKIVCSKPADTQNVRDIIKTLENSGIKYEINENNLEEKAFTIKFTIEGININIIAVYGNEVIKSLSHRIEQAEITEEREY